MRRRSSKWALWDGWDGVRGRSDTGQAGVRAAGQIAPVPAALYFLNALLMPSMRRSVPSGAGTLGEAACLAPSSPLCSTRIVSVGRTEFAGADVPITM